MPPDSNQILTVAQMRAGEEALIAAGETVDSLMLTAGRGAAEWVWRVAAGRPVTVLCGPGNNGGDGYVIAETLRRRGLSITVVAPMEPKTGAAQRARVDYGGAFAERGHGGVIVDCLFGSGLTRPPGAELAGLVRELARHHAYRVAIDLPSGVESDSGALLDEDLPRYDLTIALGAWKFAHWLMPAMANMGERRLVGIGIAAVGGAAQVIGRPHLGPPARDAHKYSRGLLAVVGGAMPGASVLAAEAAAHGGAGYVRLSSVVPVATSHAIVPLSEPQLDRARAVLIGPGLGRDAVAWKLLENTMSAGVPVVADADALWLLAEMGQGGLPNPAIVTPHEGEFEHVLGDDKGSKIDRTRSAATRTGWVIVHKGPDTVIAAPDGRVAVAPPGSTWLSTAGTGDVLAGLCAARLAVTREPFRAACEAVWLQHEAARLSGASFIADDLVARIAPALSSCL